MKRDYWLSGSTIKGSPVFRSRVDVSSNASSSRHLPLRSLAMAFFVMGITVRGSQNCLGKTPTRTPTNRATNRSRPFLNLQVPS